MERPNTRILILTFLLMVTVGAGAQEPKKKAILTYLRPYRSIEIHSPDRGTIESLKIKKGEQVKKGQLLLSLDSALIEARLAIAKAQAGNVGAIQAAEADEKLNRDRLAIIAKLRERGTTNVAEYERQKAQLKVSEANLIAAQEEQKVFALQVGLIEVELERRRLRSPVNGTVTEISADEGESVSPTTSPQEPLIRIVELDRLRAKAFVPFERARGLKEGDTIEIAIRGHEEMEILGTVEFRSPLADPATTTVEIIAVVDNPDLKFPVGVQAEFVLSPPPAE